jgi:hypothetical protein
MYKLSLEGFNKALKKNLPGRLLVIFIAMTAALYLGSKNPDFDSHTLFFIIPLFLVIFTVPIVISIKKQKQSWLSYELYMTSDSILRKQSDLPDVKICKNNISSIEETIGNGILIKTLNKNYQIAIPSSLIGYEEVKQQISNWSDIKESVSTAGKYMPIIAGIAVIILYIIIFGSESKFLVIPTGILFILLMLWSIISIQRNKNIENKYKRLAFIIIFPLLSVIYRTVYIIIK